MIIKFRAWDDERKVMVRAKLVELENLHMVDSRGFDLMLFTGLFDSHGVKPKEIYESDVCKYYDDSNTEQIGAVVWSDGAYYLEALGGDDEGNQDIQLHPAAIIFVVGNIHENSDLLNE